MKLGFIFIHGWGYDDYFWSELKTHLPDYPTLFFSRPYFTSAARENAIDLCKDISILSGRKWIIICHSYGLARLGASIHLQKDLIHHIGGVVSISGFFKFVKDQEHLYGVEPAILRKMINKFESYPLVVLEEFHARCQFARSINIKIHEIINTELLIDLKNLFMIDVENVFSQFIKPTLIMSSSDDLIINNENSFILQRSLPISYVAMRETGGHALGFNEAKWCSNKINYFIQGICRKHG
jgi:pimeloyl-ACP methyl ester carboxylesterase